MTNAVVFGDSMAFGVMTDSTGAPLVPDYLVPWAYTVAYQRNYAVHMLAQSATPVGQQAGNIYGYTSVSPDRHFSMPGRADAEIYGASTGAVALFNHAVGAMTYWLSGANTKALGAGWTTTGTWTTTPVLGLGIYTGTDGATIQIPFTGPTLAFGYLIQDGNYSSFTVSVDGGPSIGPIPCSGEITIGVGSFPNYQPALFRASGLGAGAHIATITAICPSSPNLGSNHVLIDWAMTGGSNGLPLYIVSQPLSTVVAPATVSAYNAVLYSIITNAAADGLNVVLVDSGPKFTSVDLSGDGIHQSQRGHWRIAYDVLAAGG